MPILKKREQLIPLIYYIYTTHTRFLLIDTRSFICTCSLVNMRGCVPRSHSMIVCSNGNGAVLEHARGENIAPHSYNRTGISHIVKHLWRCAYLYFIQ